MPLARACTCPARARHVLARDRRARLARPQVRRGFRATLTWMQQLLLWHLVCTDGERDNEQKVLGAYEVNLVYEMRSRRFNIVSP